MSRAPKEPEAQETPPTPRAGGSYIVDKAGNYTRLDPVTGEPSSEDPPTESPQAPPAPPAEEA